jgi:diguanylate cyclase (GGDEF)-like protein/PAS domain S-box-containing protein
MVGSTTSGGEQERADPASAPTTQIPAELQQDVDRQAAQLRARYEQASTAQSLLDMGGNHVSVNDAYCDLLGWPREELLGRPLAELAHACDLRDMEATLAGLRSGAQVSASFEAMLRQRDGHAVPVLVDVTVLRDPDDAPDGMACFVRDLTAVREAEDRLARQEALFQALNRRASDVALVHDAETNIVYVSPSVTEIFDYDREDLVGVTGAALIHPDDLPTVKAGIERALRQQDGVERFTVRVKDGRGRWRWVEETLTNCLSDPDIGGLVANLRDVAAQVQAQEELRRSEARYRAIAETAQEGIAVIDPEGGVLFANQKLAEILGLSLEATYAHDARTLFEAQVDADAEPWHGGRALTGPETFEIGYHHPDGARHLLSISAAPFPLPESGDVGLLTMVSDVTEARRAERELRRQALHDALTDLPNRALLSDRLDMAIRRRERMETGSVALIFLDLDQFKLVNDSRGHDAGDELLVEIGSRLQRAIRPGDTVARFGGDEFAVLCEDVDEQAARQVAERLRAALGEPVEIRGHRVYVDASIGIALSPPHEPDTLLRFADTAMYRAKSEGRGRIRVFDSTLATGADRKLMVMSALHEALDKNSLHLHYQPIVDIRTGALRGVEALLRWTDDRLGEVSPVEVVAAAESMGMLFALDEWVLRKASEELAQARPGAIPADAYLSVNVSAGNIGAMPLDDLVVRTVEATGWPAHRLVLEVTESAIMADAESAVRLLTRLRELGVAIAVDDFGTGYSSLAYLKRLPVSVLKIDRSFVDQVTVDPDSLAIATSIVDLSRALGLRTVAEGIETPDQAAAMLRLGCTNGQGYLWSPAVPVEDLGCFGR